MAPRTPKKSETDRIQHPGFSGNYNQRPKDEEGRFMPEDAEYSNMGSSRNRLHKEEKHGRDAPGYPHDYTRGNYDKD